MALSSWDLQSTEVLVNGSVTSTSAFACAALWGVLDVLEFEICSCAQGAGRLVWSRGILGKRLPVSAGK